MVGSAGVLLLQLVIEFLSNRAMGTGEGGVMGCCGVRKLIAEYHLGCACMP